MYRYGLKVTYYFYARRNARRIHSVCKRISYKRAGKKVCGFNTVSMEIYCQIGTQSKPSEMKTSFCALAIMKISKLPNLRTKVNGKLKIRKFNWKYAIECLV